MNIVLKNLKNFILTHKIVFTIFILCEFVSFATATYMAAQFASNQKEWVEGNLAYKTFSIESSFSNEDISNKISQVKEKFPQVLMVKVYMDKLRMQANAIYPPKTERYVYSGRYFSEDEFYNGAKQIIINEDSENFSVGNIIKIQDMILEVIGVNYSIGNYSEIPYSALTNLEEITRLSFSLEKIPKSEERELFLSSLKEIFQTDEIKSPENINILAVSSVTIEYLVCIVVPLFLLYNLSFLYEYVLNSRKKNFAVMRLVGCSSKKAFSIFGIEILIISTIVYSLSCVFLAFVVIPITIYFDIEGINFLYFEDYIRFYIIIMVATFFIFSSVIKKNTERNISILL